MKSEMVFTKSSRGVIWRLLSYVRPYWGLVFLALLGLVAGTAADLSLPLLIRSAIDDHILPRRQFTNASANQDWYIRIDDKTLDQEELQAQLIRHDGSVYMPEQVFNGLEASQRKLLRVSDSVALTQFAMVFLGLLLASILGNFLQIVTTALTGQKVMLDLRMQLMRKTMNQSLGFLQSNPVGRLVTRLTNDVETVNELFTSVLTAFIKDIAIMTGVLIVLFNLDTNLALVSLLAVVPVLLLLTGFRTLYQKAYRTSRTMVSRMNTFLSEHFSGMLLVQVFVRQAKVLKKFIQENEDLKRASLGEMYVFAIFRPLVDLLASVGLALVLWAGAGRLLGGFVSLGLLVAFMNLLQKFFEPILDISDKFNILQSAIAGAERAFELLDEDSALDDTGQKRIQEIKGELRFQDVVFAYKEGEPVLQSLSFTAQPGEKLAIVGYTGAGKTTIASVLTRLWDIQGGSILVDGIPLRDMPLKYLRSSIQPIQQDAFLFNDTVRENLTLGKELSDEKIWEALRRVEAEDFVQALPGKLDALIQENATNISSGQKQLLNFARILVQDPAILIMDEASANIDTETERKIQHAMHEVMSGRTSLVIAHRLSTIKDAHKILVLDKGKVIESGTHADLLAQRGQYERLYRLQFGQGAN